ncbi:hypothetical protein [Desertivirga brevis]|uniref:hypothetical protein n=1 Tax=Desertivirga brevis TaxID=2810310 RepID=UPI001A9764EE|nr:hypothetical protein [Pedobacter sp. SYSU D00873]
MKQHSTSLTTITLLFLFLSLHTKAQEFKAEIKDLSFIQGKWQLKHQWGDMEEF